MSEINIVNLLKGFKKEDLKPVTLIYGKEDYLKLQFQKIIKKNFPDVTVLWGDEITIKELKASLSGGSLFSTENIVLLKNLEGFLKNLNKKELEEFTNFLLKIHEPDRLFIFSNEDKLPTKEPYKTLKISASLVVSKPLSPKGFLSTLEKRIKKEGKKISPEDLRYLAELLKNDLIHAKHEVDKLLLYTKDKNEITREDIEKIIIPKVEENIFAFINDFFLKKEDILKRYKNLIEIGHHPFEIQSFIFNQLNKLLLYIELKNKGIPTEEIFARLGIKFKFQKDQLKNQAEFNKLEELIYLLKSLYKLEIRQKVYYENPYTSLERLILDWIS
jgi:DNA polymerase-3 subunit delta